MQALEESHEKVHIRLIRKLEKLILVWIDNRSKKADHISHQNTLDHNNNHSNDHNNHSNDNNNDHNDDN